MYFKPGKVNGNTWSNHDGYIFIIVEVDPF
jgi:hypothetical protein